MKTIETIKTIINKHITNYNSFIDKNGHNHFEKCVKELWKELKPKTKQKK